MVASSRRFNYNDATMGTLTYRMNRNPLRGGGVIVRLGAKGAADLDDVARHIAETRNTRYSKETVKDVVEELRRTVLFYLSQGIRVNLDAFMEIYPVYCGRFESLEARLEGDTSGLGIRCEASQRFAKELARRVTLTHDGKPSGRFPLLTSYEDAATGRSNATLTAGTIGTLNGRHLKFDPTQQDEGIFFVIVSTGQETRVTMVSHNKPSQLIFMVPPLIPEKYRVAVRTRPYRVKTLRTCELSHLLECAAQ